MTTETTQDKMTIAKGRELKVELDKAWEWIAAMGKINRELLEYIMEIRNGKQ